MQHRFEAIDPRSIVISFGLGLAAIFGSGSPAVADIAWGEMASAIRSAGFPCAQVLSTAPIGDNIWSVECNSGKFRVARDPAGLYSVSPDD